MNDMKSIIICIHQTFLWNEFLFAFRAKDVTFLWNEFGNENSKDEHRPQQQTTNNKHQTPNKNSCFKGSKRSIRSKMFFLNSNTV